MTRLILASRGIPELPRLLGGAGPDAVLIPTAANPLGDPSIADEVEDELRAAGLVVERLDLDEASPDDVATAVEGAGVVAVSGGDPFHLLAAARRTRFAEAVRGRLYIGYSAGAMVAGPTLEPLRRTSPFAPPPGLDLAGLGLTEVLVLPHHSQRSRAATHADAVARYGDRVVLRPLSDGEVLVIDA